MAFRCCTAPPPLEINAVIAPSLSEGCLQRSLTAPSDLSLRHFCSVRDENSGAMMHLTPEANAFGLLSSDLGYPYKPLIWFLLESFLDQ